MGFVDFELAGSEGELAVVVLAAVGLYLAKELKGALKLAGEPLAVKAERGEGSMRVDHVELVVGISVGSAGDEFGFEGGDAIEAPGSVGKFLGELVLSGRTRLVLVVELLAVFFVSFRVLGRQHGLAASESVGDGILRRPEFAVGRARTGRILGIAAV